jgi:protein-disulfide isomerase
MSSHNNAQSRTPASRPWSWSNSLDVIVSVVLLASAGALLFVTLRDRPLFRESRTFSLPTARQSLVGASLIGSKEAPVAMIVYSDFQCPFCGKFARDTVPVLRSSFVNTGKLAIVFRHLPIDRIHPNARRAAQAAECAGRQGLFWDIHDTLFAIGLPFERGALEQTLTAVGGNPHAWQECVDGPPVDQIHRDTESATALGIRSTPFILLGPVEFGELRVTRSIAGAKAVSTFVDGVEAILAEQSRGRRRPG